MNADAKTTAHRAMKGGTWLVISAIITNALQFASVVVVARFLLPADYGLVATATTILFILSSVTEMYLGEALIRQRDPQSRDIDTIWTLGLLRGLICASVFALLAYPVSRFYGDDRLIEIMLVLALTPLAMGLQNPYRFIQQRNLVFSQEFVITVSQKVISVIVTVACAILFKSYWALIIGNVAFFTSATIISFFLNAYRPRFSLHGAREVLNFSVWVMLSQIVNVLNGRFELLVIGRFLGMGTLGLYSMGSNLAIMATEEIMKPLRRVIYPAFTRVLHSTSGTADQQRLRNAYQRTQSLVTALVLPISIGFALIADPLVRLIFSERWHEVIFILQYLSAVFGFQTIGSLVRPLGMAKGHTNLLFVRDTQMLFLRMPIIIGAMVMWGLTGVVIARIFTGLISMFVNLRLIDQFLDLPIRTQLGHNFRAISSVCVMGIGIYFLGEAFGVTDAKGKLAITLSMEIVAGALIYIASTSILWKVMGKPAGPESEILRIAGSVFARLSK